MKSSRILGVVFLLVQACRPQNEYMPGGRKPDTQSIAPGFGHSDARPAGEPFKLPNGLILKSLYGSYKEDRDKAGKTGKLRGSGLGAQLLAVLQNTSGQTITLTLPAGLMFIPNDNTFKNAMLVKPVVLQIAPNATENYVLMAHEINVRPIYVVPGADYQIGPVTQHPVLKELFQRIVGKKINFEEWSENKPDADYRYEHPKYKDFRDNVFNLSMTLTSVTQDGELDDYVMTYLTKLK